MQDKRIYRLVYKDFFKKCNNESLASDLYFPADIGIKVLSINQLQILGEFNVKSAYDEIVMGLCPPLSVKVL